MTDAPKPGPNRLKQAGEILLKILGLFVLLEPIWMLLPFAGFLYGSVLHLQTLAKNPATAWLTHFVFPVLTLGPLGPILVVVGGLLFFAGAGQIYLAKIRRSGIVTGGLYRFVRHPQYIALTLFGGGILLTWGRAVTFIALFAMMVLYYFLARVEESKCIELFGKEYEDYRERTSFVFPGDRALRGVFAPLQSIPGPARAAAGIVVAFGACFGALFGIQAVKTAVRTVPFLSATVELPVERKEIPESAAPLEGEMAGGVPFVTAGRLVVVRGPYRNAAAAGFAERLARRIPGSPSLRPFLSFLEGDRGDHAFVFATPFERPEETGREANRPKGPQDGRRGPPPDPHGPDRVRLMIFRVALAPGAGPGDAFTDPSERRVGRAFFAPVDLGVPETEDIVAGEIFRPGPGFPGEKQFGYLLGQIEERGASPAAAAPAVEPGVHGETLVVMVKAPILRTRRDPPFAQAILDRLTRSDRFRAQLASAGAGGKVLPVAFPTPGDNWYREHHGVPQIRVFVMLVARPDAAADPAAVFKAGPPVLSGAFTAVLDFAAAPDADGVTGIETIGPRRDLLERWNFFLSGL